MNKPILVTSPYLPPLEEYVPYLQKIWDNHWLTNNGKMHKELEKELAQYLGVDYIVATTHALWRNSIKPIFVNIGTKTGDIDPSKIEEAITPKTTMS